MDSNTFIKQQRRKAAAVASYINDAAPLMVARKTLRFVEGNFQAQGWQGEVFKPWKNKYPKKKGQINIVTSRMRRGVNYTTNGRGEVRFYNNVPYADIHNRGGIINATAHVRAFTRRRFYADEVSAPGARKPKFTKTHIGDSEVKAHTRIMKIVMPQNQFMPYDDHGSPVLDNAIKRDLEKDLKAILTA